MAKVKGKETHITIKSTQSKSSQSPSNKQTSNAKNESKSNQFLSKKKNTHNFFFSFSVTVGSTFVRPFQ
jgi:protein involved in sex pheromone biosynthesis